MDIKTAKELIAELAPMLEAGTIEDIEHHIRLLSEAATVVAKSLECAELLNESHVNQCKARRERLQTAHHKRDEAFKWLSDHELSHEAIDAIQALVAAMIEIASLAEGEVK